MKKLLEKRDLDELAKVVKASNNNANITSAIDTLKETVQALELKVNAISAKIDKVVPK